MGVESGAAGAICVCGCVLVARDWPNPNPGVVAPPNPRVGAGVLPRRDVEEAGVEDPKRDGWDDP